MNLGCCLFPQLYEKDAARFIGPGRLRWEILYA